MTSQKALSGLIQDMLDKVKVMQHNICVNSNIDYLEGGEPPIYIDDSTDNVTSEIQ